MWLKSHLHQRELLNRQKQSNVNVGLHLITSFQYWFKVTTWVLSVQRSLFRTLDSSYMSYTVALCVFLNPPVKLHLYCLCAVLDLAYTWVSNLRINLKSKCRCFHTGILICHSRNNILGATNNINNGSDLFVSCPSKPWQCENDAQYKNPEMEPAKRNSAIINRGRTGKLNMLLLIKQFNVFLLAWQMCYQITSPPSLSKHKMRQWE